MVETNEVWGDPVELNDIPLDKDVCVVRSKLLMTCKGWELLVAQKLGWKIKGRFVALGDVIYSRDMTVRKDLGGEDHWAPVATLTGVRLVHARRTF